MSFGGPATLGQVVSLSVECGDCGRLRWRKPHEFYRMEGIAASTPLSDLGVRLVCSACRAQGAEGRNIVIQAAFSCENDRLAAEAWGLNSREVHAAG
jgi:hypothetical protein